MLRTDCGKEYRATDLFCESTGIHRQRTESNQGGIENETAEGQENQQSTPNKNDTQGNKSTNKNNRKVGYRTEGVHTRSKTKKAAMVSIEEDLCFFMGQEDPKTYSQATSQKSGARQSRTRLSL
jgi:hypothetical protein